MEVGNDIAQSDSVKVSSYVMIRFITKKKKEFDSNYNVPDSVQKVKKRSELVYIERT